MDNKAITPPTLACSALRGRLAEYECCGSTLPDGGPEYRAAWVVDGPKPMWIYRLRGVALGGMAESTIVRFCGVPLVEEHMEMEKAAMEAAGESEEWLEEWRADYVPEAESESSRIFFAGTADAARDLMGALESVGSESHRLANALERTGLDDMALEAAMFVWPQGDVGVLALCNVGKTTELRAAVDEMLALVAERYPGAIEAMESRGEHGYTFALDDIWRDASIETGSVSERAMLAVFDQVEGLRIHYERDIRSDDSMIRRDWRRLGRALERRALEAAASGDVKKEKAKIRV